MRKYLLGSRSFSAYFRRNSRIGKLKMINSRYIPIFGTKFCPSLRFCVYKRNVRIKSTFSILSTPNLASLRMYTESSEKRLHFSACTQNKSANVFSVHIQTHLEYMYRPSQFQVCRIWSFCKRTQDNSATVLLFLRMYAN